MSLPEFPLNVAEEIQTEIESWYSAHVYEKLAEKDPNNIWVRLGETIDFSPVEAACEEYHKRTSGKNVPHKVKRMVRGLFVKYMLGTSVRMAAERIQYAENSGKVMRCKKEENVENVRMKNSKNI